MRISDVMRIIEDYAPTSLAEDFDNVGLLVGDEGIEVTGALLSLDVDLGVAAEAKARGANLIISHHPIIFDPVKSITANTPMGRCLMFLIQNEISVYCAHTNLDSAAGGLNDLIAALLELEHTEPIKDNGSGEGLGRVGTLAQPLTMEALAGSLKKKFKVPFIRYSGGANDVVSRAAVCSGGGGGLLEYISQTHADVYITGDLKYNDARAAAAQGINIIEVSHYDSEILAPQLFEKILGDNVKTFITESNVNVFNIF